MARAPVGLTLAILAAGIAAGAVAAAYDPVQALAGRYSAHFPNGLVDGSSFWSDDVVEIAPIDARHAYVRFALNFYNGHTCDLAGIAQAEGDALVYRGLPEDSWGDDKPCHLTIRRAGAKLTWNDRMTCKSHCGARGSFSDGEVAWASKRRIGYLARLRSSRQYRDALTEWRTGKPARP